MGRLIDDFRIELTEPACHVGAARYGAVIHLDRDTSAIFPYLNALYKDARYDHQNQVLILQRQDRKYAFRPHEIRVAEVQNLNDAHEIAMGLVKELNRTWEQRDTIQPDYTERTQPPVMEVFKLLPGTNCRQCGYATCMAFAAALSRGGAAARDCPPLADPGFEENRAKLEAMCEPM